MTIGNKKHLSKQSLISMNYSLIYLTKYMVLYYGVTITVGLYLLL